jgi:hypothetical protein
LASNNTYSIIFSQQELNGNGINQMPTLTQLYLNNYACNKIRPFASSLLSVQAENRGEVSDLSAYPLFVRELRKNYLETSLKTHALVPIAENQYDSSSKTINSPLLDVSQTPPTLLDITKALTPQILKPTLGRMFSSDRQLAEEDSNEIKQIHTPVLMPGDRTVQDYAKTQDTAEDDDEPLLTGPTGACGAVGKLLSQLGGVENVIDKPPSAAWWEAVKKWDDNRLKLLAYFALSVAETEFALSAHETAVQFLETEINKIRAALAEAPFGTEDSKKCTPEQTQCQASIKERA